MNWRPDRAPRTAPRLRVVAHAYRIHFRGAKCRDEPGHDAHHAEQNHDAKEGQRISRRADPRLPEIMVTAVAGIVMATAVAAPLQKMDIEIPRD